MFNLHLHLYLTTHCHKNNQSETHKINLFGNQQDNKSTAKAFGISGSTIRVY